MEVLENIILGELPEKLKSLHTPMSAHVRVIIEEIPDNAKALPAWKEALIRAKGIWKDRPGIIAEMDDIRREFDR